MWGGPSRFGRLPAAAPSPGRGGSIRSLERHRPASHQGRSTLARIRPAGRTCAAHDPFHLVAQPVPQPVRELAGAGLAGVDDQESVTHPDLGPGRPRLLDVGRRGLRDPHVAADRRQPRPAEGGTDLGPDVREVPRVDLALGPYPHGAGGRSGAGVLEGHVLDSL